MLLPFGHRHTTIQTLVTGAARFIGSSLDFESGYLGEIEAGDITGAGVDETDEWRRTFGHLDVPNPLRWRGCSGEHAYEGGHGSNQSCVHAAFLR